MKDRMDVAAPGVEIFIGFGLVTKAEGPFNIRLVHPIDLPVFWKYVGLGVMVTADT
jgi:hypothetical protein